MPFYFIQSNDLTDKTVRIGLPLAHHLQVLRYQKGDSLTLIDEHRHQYAARILSLSSNTIESEVLSETQAPPHKKPLLHLGMAIIKGDKMDWAIQKASELGVDRITPILTRRVVVKIHKDKLAHQQKRWLEIAKESAQQSERLDIPQIDMPMPLDSFLAETQSADMKFIFWEHAPPDPITPTIHAALAQLPNTCAMIIGPEGGLEKEEVDRACEKGYIAVSLGERPVRAETAALAALTILQYEINKWN